MKNRSKAVVAAIVAIDITWHIVELCVMGDWLRRVLGY